MAVPQIRAHARNRHSVEPQARLEYLHLRTLLGILGAAQEINHDERMMMENTLFPGRPDYVGPTSGWFGLMHHQILCEKSHNVMERVEYVKTRKPAREIATRLHNMIYLGGCEIVAKIAPLVAEILIYIRSHIPDCAWNGTELIFPTTKGP